MTIMSECGLTVINLRLCERNAPINVNPVGGGECGQGEGI